MEQRMALTVRPVGEFVSDFGKRAISVQPNAVRHLNESLIREGGHVVDLHHGLEKYVERTEFKHKLIPMFCFLKISEQTYGPDAIPKPGEIICTRTSLVQIASSAFAGDQFEDTRFDDGFLVVLFKRNDNYFVCEYDTQSKKSKSGGRNLAMYAGIKFEDYMTLGEGQTEPDLQSVASTSVSYNAVFKANLVDEINEITHNLFYPAKVDCIDKDGKYTEIKFRKQPLGYGISWWRVEMIWHLQALFEDNKRIVVGLSDGTSGVTKVKSITSDLSDSEKRKGKVWNEEGCLEYLSKFLDAAKHKLDQAPDGTYYYAMRLPNQIDYVITEYQS